MKFAILLLCLTSLPYTGAHAAEVPTEQITHSVPAQLRLLGRGLMKRGSDDSLALACFDEACSSVRFVQFTNQNAKWIGAAFEHSSNDLEIERMRLQQYLLARIPEKVRISESRAWNWLAPGLVFVVVPVGYKVASAMAMSTVPALALFLGPTLAFIAADNLIYSHRNRSLVYHSRTIPFSVSEGESGWNWSQNPISISAKRFDKMVGTIRSNPVPNPISALRVITDKINQQK